MSSLLLGVYMMMFPRSCSSAHFKTNRMSTLLDQGSEGVWGLSGLKFEAYAVLPMHPGAAS